MRHSKNQKIKDKTLPVAAIDARALVPVSDEIGGVVIYLSGRPSYYVLNGEWFAAVPEPQSRREGTINASKIISTS